VCFQKWIHTFEAAAGIMFCVSLTSYDLKLFEDSNVLSLEESLRLWEEVVGMKWFQNINEFTLVLTKKDLLDEKIKSNPFKIDSTNETTTSDEAIQVITRKFQAKLTEVNPHKRFTSIAVNCFNEEDISKLLSGFVTSSRVLAL
jgi:hypothetical protein